MTPDETKMILAKASLIDNRTVDLQTIRAWHEIIGPLDFTDSLKALTIHRRESTEYLTPAHIVKNIRRARDLRETETNRQRALTAKPETGRSKPPAWFREAIANFGRETA